MLSTIKKVIAALVLATVAVVGLPAISQAATPPVPQSVTVQTASVNWNWNNWVSATRNRVGPQVVAIQKAVGAHPDGVFGPKTKAAVIKAQKRAGVTPDGIVGPATARAIGLTGGSSTSPPKSSGKTVTRYVSASTAANVRSGPGTGYKIVGSIKRGQVVKGTVTGGWLNLGGGKYVSSTVLSTSKPGKTTTPTRTVRQEAQYWAKQVTGVNVPITWQTSRWTYGSSWPQWHVAKQRGFMMNEAKIRSNYSGQAAVNVARGVSTHESIHYLQARQYGDATKTPAKGRPGIPGYEVQADCATHLIGQKYGVSMPTFYLTKCTTAEYNSARALLKAQGVL